ncbi:type II toxin-antitoxin system HicA family toxin [Methanosarcina hadiensis]
MDKIVPLPSKKVIKALESMGFVQIRQKGSHLFYGIQMEEQL